MKTEYQDPIVLQTEDVDLFGSVTSLARLSPQRRKQELTRIEGQDPNKKAERQRIALIASLLLLLITGSRSAAEFEQKLNKFLERILMKKAKNLIAIEGVLKPIEKVLRQLELLFKNAGNSPKVYILPVDPNRFLGGRTSKHFTIMQKWIRKHFYKYDIQVTPFYLTYLGVLESPDAARELADLAKETRALAVVNTPSFDSKKSLIDFFSKHFRVTGLADNLGHLILGGSAWGYSSSALESFQGTEKMTLPLGPAIIGKLIKTHPRNDLAGLQSEAINGIKSVVLDYEMERIDAPELRKYGIVPVIDSGHIQGTNTCYTGADMALAEFPNRDVANLIEKTLIDYGNRIANGTWNPDKEEQLKDILTAFFNGLVLEGMIQGYNKPEIVYNPDDKRVYIRVSVNYQDKTVGTVIELPAQRA